MSASLSPEELYAWIRLTLEPGLGAVQARAMLAAISPPQDIFALSATSLAKVVPQELARQLARPPSAAIEEAIARTQAWLAEPGHHLLTLADPNYPRTLLDTHDPPLLLYVNGRPELLNQPTLAIVGARNATAGGEDNAKAFARYLAGRGWCIASGLASGIDAAAHIGALSFGAQGGSTVAVLGTGIDIIYPASNLDLARRIAAEGALISEFPLGTPSMPHNFPKRNRIVAGMAKGVLVVEAAKRSGSLITARLAAEMGREVFAIPGSIHSPQSRGCHALIRQGAKLVESGQDIDEELGQLQSSPSTEPARAEKTVRRNANRSRPRPPGSDDALLNEHEAGSADADTRHIGINETASGKRETSSHSQQYASLLAALGYDPVHIDVLRARTGMDWATLNSQLLELEFAAAIVRLSDGRFQQR